MSDRYLWNQTGPVDPFVAQLERALASKRAQVQRAGRRRTPLARVILPLVAAAAAALWLLSGGFGTPELPRPELPPVADSATPQDTAAPADAASAPGADASASRLPPPAAQAEKLPAATGR